MTKKTNLDKELDRITEEIWNDTDWEYISFFDRLLFIAAMTPNGYIITDSRACGKDDFDEQELLELCVERIKGKIRNSVASGKYPDYC